MPLIPSHIQHLKPYVAGKSIADVKRELGLSNVIKLASNENPIGPSPKAISAIQDCLNDCNRYPDPNGFDLRTKLANNFNLSIDNVVLGAGSEGIMSSIMRTFLLDNDEIVATKNSFIGFKVLANASGKKINWVDMKDYRYNLPEMATAINSLTKIIYLANPDNPTGTYFSVDEFDEFMKLVPERVLVILDEAYFEYAQNIDNYPDSMVYRYDNVITLRTFSKAYGLSGLRVGYGFAHDELISNLMKVKLPFDPSLPAQIGALNALEDSDHLDKTLETNKRGLQYLTNAFVENTFKIIPSIANFITIVFNSEKDASRFTHSMLLSGIIVRHLIAFGMPKCVRITVGNNEENKYFIESINKFK